MKKSIIICAAVLVIVLVIVGIVVLVGSNDDTTPVNNNVVDEKGAFVFQANDDEIKLGANLLTLTLPEANSVYEAESCAFDGIEKTYTYDNFEIVTCPSEDAEQIIAIYFLNDQVSTKEGVKIGDSFEAMLQAYGEDYDVSDISYLYTQGNSTLTFLVNNDVITSIEYRLIME